MLLELTTTDYLVIGLPYALILGFLAALLEFIHISVGAECSAIIIAAGRNRQTPVT